MRLGHRHTHERKITRRHTKILICKPRVKPQKKSTQLIPWSWMFSFHNWKLRSRNVSFCFLSFSVCINFWPISQLNNHTNNQKMSHGENQSCIWAFLPYRSHQSSVAVKSSAGDTLPKTQHLGSRGRRIMTCEASQCYVESLSPALSQKQKQKSQKSC
jgi:hypothetical protein